MGYKRGDKVIVTGVTLYGSFEGCEGVIIRDSQFHDWLVDVTFPDGSHDELGFDAHELAPAPAASAPDAAYPDVYRNGDFSVYYDDQDKQYVVASGGGDPLEGRTTLEEAKAIVDGYAKEADEAPGAALSVDVVATVRTALANMEVAAAKHIVAQSDPKLTIGEVWKIEDKRDGIERDIELNARREWLGKLLAVIEAQERALTETRSRLAAAEARTRQLESALEPFAEAWRQVPYGKSHSLLMIGVTGDEYAHQTLSATTSDLEDAHTAWAGLQASETVRPSATGDV
jgi:hypothetical protein